MKFQPKLLMIFFLLLTFLSLEKEVKVFGQTDSNNLKNQNEVVTLLQQTAASIHTGNFSEAEKTIRRAVKIAPNNSDAHNLFGIVLDQLGNQIEAEKEFRNAIRLNSKAVSPLANLGVLLAKNKRQIRSNKNI